MWSAVVAHKIPQHSRSWQSSVYIYVSSAKWCELLTECDYMKKVIYWAEQETQSIFVLY